MEYLLYIVVGLVAYFVGWHLRGIVILANLSANPEKMIKMLEQIKQINESEKDEQLDTSGTTELNIERVGDVLYAYTKESGQFIAQGPDLNSLLEMATERFPNKRFSGYISKDDPAKELV